MTVYIFCCQNGKKIKADDGPCLNIFLQDYYYNLTTNYVRNETNSLCKFQSFINFLCYWDEGFIDLTYNKSESSTFTTSPGVYTNQYGTTIIDDDAYDNDEWVVDTSDYLLRCERANGILYSLLELTISNKNLFIPPLTEYQIINGGGITFEKFIDTIMESYYNQISVNISNDINNFKTSDYIIYSSNQNLDTSPSVNRLAVKNLILQGYPVIVVINTTGNENDNSHLCVCYDYDQYNDIIYAHTDFYDSQGGILYNHWNINNYGASSSNDGNVYIIDYYAIAPKNNLSHECIKIYYDIDENDEYVYCCPCELDFHVHNWEGEITDEYHNCFCFCGDEIDDDHCFETTRHNHFCIDCGYYGGHIGEYTKIDDYACIINCTICEEIKDIPHDFVQIGLRNTCKNCGATFFGSNIPVITKKEEEEYIT